MLAPFVLQLTALGPATPWLAFALPAGVAAYACSQLPETLGKPLPDTLGDIATKY